MDPIRSDGENDDLVGWLRLLDRLHVLQSHFMSSVRLSAGVGFSIGDIHDTSQGFERSISHLTIPATTSRERSWDFMSPDIVRPVATSIVRDIIALAHRLGMGWNDLRLGDGFMRAEGNGHSIVSTTVRGFGILLQFAYDPAGELLNSEAWSHVTIPSSQADKLGFGITPSWSSIVFRDLLFDGPSEDESAKNIM